MTERSEIDPIEPASDDLRALFAQERDISDAERVAIKQKLAVSIAPAPAAATTLAAGKLVGIAAAVIVAAAGIWWATHRDEPVSSPPAPLVEPAAPVVPEPAIQTTAPEPPPLAAPTAPAPSETKPSQPGPSQPGPSQPELLAKAWQTLASDPTAALNLVELDTKLHPRGALGEEREALRIEALVGLGRTDEARALATRFVDRYPRSVHRARIDRSLQ